MRASVSVIFMFGLVVAGCGEDQKECASHESSYCHKGALHWVDSCGNLEEVEEYCPCGCLADHSGCMACSCNCSEVSDCCNGCLAVAEDQPCDDGDPETLSDVCEEGVCVGWSPDDLVAPADPALPDPPADPASPEAVRLRSWTCPPGWEAVEHPSLHDQDDQIFSWCQPPPLPRLKLGTYVTPIRTGEQAGDRPICEPAVDGTFPVLGQTECQPLGEVCEDDGWPVVPGDVPGGRVYVQVGGSGDGSSQASPLGTIAAAVGAASPGDVLVIATGIYPEGLNISKDLTLWGNCPTGTVISAPGPYTSDLAGVKVVIGSQVEAHNLQITGERKGVLVESSSGKITLDGVWLNGCTGVAIDAGPGQVVMQGCLVTSTTPGTDLGVGLGTAGGAQVEISECLFERNRDVAVSITNSATTATLTDLVARETRERETTRQYGYGLEVFHGATVTVTRGLFDGNRHFAMVAAHPDTEVTLQDVTIQDTYSNQSEGTAGIGLSCESSATVNLNQVLIQRNRTVGLLTMLEQAYLNAQDIVVRDTLTEQVSNAFGRGISVYYSGQAQISRALVENTHDLGVLILDDGTIASLQDLAVLGTKSEQQQQTSGAGLMVGYDAEVTLVRGLIAGNRSAGVTVGKAAVVTLDDLTIRDTLSQEATGNMGQGLDVSEQGDVTVHRALIENNRSGGILLNGLDTRAVLEDITVLDTQSRLTDGYVGHGLHLTSGAGAEIKRVLLEGNRGTGLLVKNPDSSLTAEDLTVRDTLGYEIDSTDGYGVWVIDGAYLSLTRGLIDGNRSHGLILMDEGTEVLIHDLTVQDTLPQASDDMWGRSVEVSYGARLELTRGLFERNLEFGLFCGKPGSIMALEDVTVIDTLPRVSDGWFGIGLEVTEGGEVTLARGRFERNHLIAFVVTGFGSRGHAQDLTVTDTLPLDVGDSAGNFGVGVLVADGAHLALNRGLFTNNHMAGLIATDNLPTMLLEDVEVRDTQSQVSDGFFGWGLAAQLGGQVTLTRGLLQGNYEVGAVAIGEDANLNLDRVVIRDTHNAACYDDPEAECTDASYGTGLGVLHEASMSVDNVLVDTAEVIGVQMAKSSTFSGRALTLSNNPIGFNIQDTPPDYQFFEVVTGLRMENNQINFDSTELPVPNPMSVLE